MTIGEVAKQCGISTSAIRFYESEGLLPKPIRISGRRVYGPGILPLLALVQFSKSVGFSVRQIRTLAVGVQGEGRFSKALQKLQAQKFKNLTP